MPTYPIGQNATTARDGEVNVANVVKGHVNGSNVSDEAIIVPVLALGGASDPAVRGAEGVESWLNVNVGTAPVTPAVNNTYGSLRLTGQASIPDTPAAIDGTVTPVVYLSVEAP